MPQVMQIVAKSFLKNAVPDVTLSIETRRVHGFAESTAGRQAKISSFKYSAALQSAHVTWDDDSLDKWLTDTDSLIADNDMAYRVPKADERADIIRYLKLASGK